MKNRILMIAIVAVGLVAGAVSAAPIVADNVQPQKKNSEERKGDEQARLQSQAKITIEQAKEVALRRTAGKVESSELEREHGKLVYSFDIRNDKGTITEVQVDAVTGKIARVEHENAKQEANEKRREEKKPRKSDTQKP